jgi:hypothetical protein
LIGELPVAARLSEVFVYIGVRIRVNLVLLNHGFRGIQDFWDDRKFMDVNSPLTHGCYTWVNYWHPDFPNSISGNEAVLGDRVADSNTIDINT